MVLLVAQQFQVFTSDGKLYLDFLHQSCADLHVEFPILFVDRLIDFRLFVHQHNSITLALRFQELDLVFPLENRAQIFGRIILRIFAALHAIGRRRRFLDFVFPTDFEDAVHHFHQGALTEIVGEKGQATAFSLGGSRIEQLLFAWGNVWSYG